MTSALKMPKAWAGRPLGELALFLDHMRRPVTASERKPGPYPYYGANGQQDSVADYIFDEPLVLLAEDGGHFGDPTRTIAYSIEGKSWVNNHAHVLRPKEHVCFRYLTRALERYDVTPYISGTTRMKLTKGQAERLEIPIPFPDDPVRSLAEQKRIAAILDKADGIRRKRTLSTPLWRDAIVSGINHLADMGDAESWPVAELDTFIQSGRPICYGILMPGPDLPNGHPYVRVVDIKNDRVCLDTVRRTHADIYRQYLRSVIRTGDLLLSIRGHVGRMAVTPRELDGANITQDTARLAIADQSLAPYVFWYLNTVRAKRWMDRHVRGVAVRGINIGDVRRIPIPRPPDDVAKAFSQIAADLQDAASRSESAECEANALFGSLVQRAFRGEL